MILFMLTCSCTIPSWDRHSWEAQPFMSVLATDGAMVGTGGIDGIVGTDGIPGDTTDGILGDLIDGIHGEDLVGIAGEDLDGIAGADLVGTIGAGTASMVARPISEETIHTGTMSVTTQISGVQEEWDPIRPHRLME